MDSVQSEVPSELCLKEDCMNIRVLTAACALVLLLAGCAARECVTFTGKKICIGDSELGVRFKLRHQWDDRADAFVERPGDFGTMGIIWITFSEGRVQRVEEGSLIIDP